MVQPNRSTGLKRAKKAMVAAELSRSTSPAEDPGQQGFSLLVSATRIPNLAAEVSGQAIVPVRPLQTTVTENLLFLPPDGVQPALQVFGLDEVDPETVFAQSSGLVAVVPKQRVFDIQAIASSAPGDLA